MRGEVSNLVICQSSDPVEDSVLPSVLPSILPSVFPSVLANELEPPRREPSSYELEKTCSIEALEGAFQGLEEISGMLERLVLPFREIMEMENLDLIRGSSQHGKAFRAAVASNWVKP